MKKIIALIFLIMIEPARSQDAVKIVDDILGDDGAMKELYGKVVAIGASCASPNNWPIAYNELVKILQGVGRVVVEQGQTLLYKKDYPTICHVMTNSHIDVYTDEMVQTGHKRLNKGTPWEVNIEEYQPRPSYYWPKYFIEVSTKGNDSHSAFASGNMLYTANRKIANSLGKFFDFGGSTGLATKLLGMSLLTDNLKKTGIEINGIDTEQLGKGAVLAPFEEMRIRANHQKTQASYDVNIWPVGLSQVVGDNLSVCGGLRPDIGYSWPIKGIPMTCPVAMSKDAYSFWDTGMIDYLDPTAVGAMAIAGNPVACGLAQAGQMLGDMGAAKSGFMGESSQIDGAVGNLTSKLSNAIRPCSWPLLGPAEAIANKAASMTSATKWAGPHCTLWGSLAPRSSVSLYQNDFNFANSALKFKLMAHELFGTPRAEQERWSLAYPWEGPGATGIPGGDLFKDINFDSISNLLNFDVGEGGDWLKSKMDQVGLKGGGANRAEMLALPGDPRLVDTSLHDIGDQMTNLAKELGYLIAIHGVTDEAGKRAREQYEKSFGKIPDPKTIMDDLDRETGQAEDETAWVSDEDVYEEKTYCSASADKKGDFIGSPTNRFSVHYNGYVTTGGTYNFEEDNSLEHCWGHNIGHCKRDWTKKCKKKRKGQLIFYKRLVKVGTRKVQNPKILRLSRSPCQVDHRVTKARERDFVYCEDRLEVVKQTDTRQRVTRPDASDGSTITRDDETAEIIEQAARASSFAAIEIARAKYADITGKNHLPGKKRIYTIWEKVQCNYPATKIKWKSKAGEFTYYSDCGAAIRYEVYKFVQQKFLRRICDGLGQKVGDPWK